MAKKLIDQLIEAMKKTSVTKRDVKELKEILAASERKFEEKRREDDRNFHRWLNQSYTI